MDFYSTLDTSHLLLYSFLGWGINASGSGSRTFGDSGDARKIAEDRSGTHVGKRCLRNYLRSLGDPIDGHHETPTSIHEEMPEPCLTCLCFALALATSQLVTFVRELTISMERHGKKEQKITIKRATAQKPSDQNDQNSMLMFCTSPHDFPTCNMCETREN